MKLKLAAAAVGLALSVPAFAADVNSGASINQTGNGNYGAIEQSGALNGNAAIDQYGDNNKAGSESASGGVTTVTAGITQIGTTGAFAQWVQYGNGNWGSITQTASANVTANIDQGGPNNGAIILSNDNYASASQNAAPNSKIGIHQYGNGNAGYADQTGSSNESNILQVGNLNIANTYQTGSGATVNLASITQTGNSFSAGIIQHGSGNTGKISQH